MKKKPEEGQGDTCPVKYKNSKMFNVYGQELDPRWVTPGVPITAARAVRLAAPCIDWCALMAARRFAAGHSGHVRGLCKCKCSALREGGRCTLRGTSLGS